MNLKNEKVHYSGIKYKQKLPQKLFYGIRYIHLLKRQSASHVVLSKFSIFGKTFKNCNFHNFLIKNTNL